MENIRVFKGIDKNLRKNIIINCFADVFLYLVAMFGLAKIPYRWGYNHYMDSRIMFFSIMKYAALVMSVSIIALFIVSKKNEIQVLSDRLKISAVEVKMLYFWRKTNYEILIKDIQMISVKTIGNYSYVSIFAGKEYLITLEEPERCVDLIKQIKNGVKTYS